MRILVLDNYDSFTYNLVHMVRELGHAPEVFRNDRITLEAVGQFDKILLSPGPGIPSEAGSMQELIRRFAPLKDLLGVCLGHQGIAEAFGGRLVNLKEVLHGVTSRATVTKADVLFDGLPVSFTACHYHSWAVDGGSLPPELETTAVNNQGIVMALRHVRYRVRGVQFHPESIMTEHGMTLLKNWIAS
jgi:anthranilate synthase component 2